MNNKRATPKWSRKEGNDFPLRYVSHLQGVTGTCRQARGGGGGGVGRLGGCDGGVSSSSSLRACSPDGRAAHTGSGLAPQNVLQW